MIRLMKYFSWRNWIAIFFILGLTVFQVYCTMTLTDYVSGIVTAITYLHYHNAPSGIPGLGAMIAPMVDSLGWDGLLAYGRGAVEAGTMAPEAFSILEKVANASTGDIWWNAGMMVLFATITMVAQMVIAVLAAYVSSSLATNIRGKVNEKISGMSLEGISKFSVPSLVTRSTNDVQQSQFAYLLMFRMVFAAPVTAIWAIAKIQVSGAWQLTSVSAAGVVFILIGTILLMTLAIPRFKKFQTLLDRLNGVARESITGVRVVRAYNAEKYQDEKFEQANEALTHNGLVAGRLIAMMNPWINIAMNGVSLAIYWIGAYLIHDQQSGINYSQVTQYSMLSSQIIMSFMMILMLFIMLPRAQVAAKRIHEVLATPETVLDPEEEEAILDENRGCLEFSNVSFTYPNGEADVVEGIDFKIKKGQTLAIIGSTGSGKSTLVYLMNRLFDVREGSVKVDGVDVRNMKKKTLRSLLGYIPQKGFLFSGTIASNIAFSDPSMPIEQIEEAAKIACADSFIGEMPEKYESTIAQGGTNVSGGQRQRLCIARAIAKKPEILIFDDSFSALDFKTDRQVRENLKESAKDSTKVVVAQRIGTIMDADLILVISEGKIVGKGKHQELLEECPVYREIALSQLSKEELGL